MDQRKQRVAALARLGGEKNNGGVAQKLQFAANHGFVVAKELTFLKIVAIRFVVRPSGRFASGRFMRRMPLASLSASGFSETLSLPCWHSMLCHYSGVA